MRETKLEITARYRRTPKGVLTNIYQHMKARSAKYGYELSITLDQLHDRFLLDRKYIRIFNRWVKKGFQYYDKPSVDRKDPNIGYTLNNIQIMTWRQNRDKGDIEVAIKKWKPVWACDLSGKKIKKYPSIKEAAAKMDLRPSLISSTLASQQSHTGGYKFQFA